MEDLSYQRFTAKSEADKAINSLKGLLIGIAIDGIVDDDELKELDHWCKKHNNLIRRNHFKEFIITIQGAIKEPENRLELIEDLTWLCQKYENDNIYYNAVTSELQILQGICHGILADGIIEDKEVFELSKWLDAHTHLTSYYPYDEIKSLILSILADGIIDDDERKRLFAYFNEFVNISDEKIAKKVEDEIIGVPIQGVCTSDPEIDFDGKTFCLTGLSKRGTRKEIGERITNQGGIFKNTVSGNTDYLIVGNNDNPCWAFACYGRKVETAINLRKKGKSIVIIHEYDFWDILEDLE
ncbi:BRCT domain-containing protein [Saccharicrinis aurantiacus]|uniref:BRCT domain-containing protein n=1 Tax=Saccharicrinis aurantiacus TaxID=1849719 RepID=UPI00094FA3C5|nr:BRCT domain-containing protein [Saccharicrinis aurantiacus]